MTTYKLDQENACGSISGRWTFKIPVLKDGVDSGVVILVKIPDVVDAAEVPGGPAALLMDIVGRLALVDENSRMLPEPNGPDGDGLPSDQRCHCAGNQAVCTTCGLRIVG